MAATVVVTGLVLVDVPGARTFFETAVPTAAETRLTGLHGMRVTSFSLPALAGRRGGGLVQAGSVLVMADGAGSLGVLDRASPGTWRRIDVATPMDTEPMRDAAGRDDHAGRMRVMDVAVRRDGEGWELFLSHHVFRLDEGCFAVRVSRIRLDSSLVSARPGEDWGAVFETRPCVPYFQEDRGEPHFRGNDSGGRLAWLEPEVLLLTVGDHMRDGLAADRGSDYGKTIRLDLSGPVAVASHFTTGHRNPQGVAVADGVVWETEHGPQGGDELNRLLEGADYGWDRSSLGTDYGALTFESVASTPPAAGAEVREPVYAWMPSLGVSDIAVVEGSGFHRWKGDLLIASLKAGSLRRLRLSGDRVVYDEPIPLGRRIRAITEDSQGAFWLRTDGPEVLRLEVDDSGAEAWGRCTQCHGLVEDPALAGPQLGDVEGRRVASVPGFAYSPALQAVRGTWTRARLDAFLADPQSLAPGTTMEMDPIVDPEVRRRILDHMAAADRR
jgi:cytochrome c2